jgi:hypothetical protein
MGPSPFGLPRAPIDDPRFRKETVSSKPVALLTFTRNNVTDGLALLRRLPTSIDEAIVVDSSDPEGSAQLERELPKPIGRLVRAIPTGYSDLLIPFGVSEIRAEWVLHCDPDEEVSPGLANRLTRLGDSEGFIVPRYETSPGAYTYHLRLFRPDWFRPADPTYSFPGIDGRVRKLPEVECLIHHRSYGPPLSADYAREMMDIESFERPLDRKWLRDVLPWPRLRRADKAPGPNETNDAGEPLSPAAAMLGTLSATTLGLLRTGSRRFAAFQWRYNRARASFRAGLPAPERARRQRITAETRQNGGLTHYLGFDDPSYVRALTSTFAWDRPGLDVLHELIRYRFEQGRPLPDWRAAGISINSGLATHKIP